MSAGVGRAGISQNPASLSTGLDAGFLSAVCVRGLDPRRSAAIWTIWPVSVPSVGHEFTPRTTRPSFKTAVRVELDGVVAL